MPKVSPLVARVIIIVVAFAAEVTCVLTGHNTHGNLVLAGFLAALFLT